MVDLFEMDRKLDIVLKALRSGRTNSAYKMLVYVVTDLRENHHIPKPARRVVGIRHNTENSNDGQTRAPHLAAVPG
jgi:hypothetical protein